MEKGKNTLYLSIAGNKYKNIFEIFNTKGTGVISCVISELTSRRSDDLKSFYWTYF